MKFWRRTYAADVQGRAYREPEERCQRWVGVNAQGEVLLFDALRNRAERFVVPSKTSGVGAAKLWTVATLQEPLQNTRLRAFMRGAELPDTTASAVALRAGVFAEPPSITQTGVRRISVTSTAALIWLRAYAHGELLAEGIILPGSGDFELPAQASAADSVTLAAYHADVDPREFALVPVRETASAIAERTISLGMQQ